MEISLINKSDTLPKVSVVIPMYNEIDTIEQCIGSVLHQVYPQKSIEIVVVDGCSKDGSREKVEELGKKNGNIRLLDNPDQMTPKALNIGIKNAHGDVVIILGAHTKIKDDFISQNIANMQKMNVKCVGGTQINVGETYTQRAIGYAMGSLFGIPSAPYRFWKKEKFVDTVVYAAYKKELFDEIGYFDEKLLISEDAEFNWRIRKAGYKIFYNPQIISYYYPRKSIVKLIKQLFRYGILRVNVIKKHLDAAKPIHLVPPLFILVSIALLILGFFNSIFMSILAAIWGFYFFCILIATIITSLNTKLKYFFILPIIFPSIHLSWGSGFVVGIFKSQYK